MQMDSRGLQHFVAVVDHGGFTAVSKATFVSQPALSLGRQRTRGRPRTPPLDRIGRRVPLTAAGPAPRGPARQVLRDLDTGRAAVERCPASSRGSCPWPAFRPSPLTPRPTSSVDSGGTIQGVRVDLGCSRGLPAPVRSRRDRYIRAGTHRRVGRAWHTRISGTWVPKYSSSSFPRAPRTAIAATPEVDRTSTTRRSCSPRRTPTRRLLDERLGSVGLIRNWRSSLPQRDAILPLVHRRCRRRPGPRFHGPHRPTARRGDLPAESAGRAAFGPHPSSRRPLPAASRFSDLAVPSLNLPPRLGQTRWEPDS